MNAGQCLVSHIVLLLCARCHTQVCFGILLLVIRFGAPGGLPMATVPMFANDHSQYEFGVAAIIFTVLYGVCFAFWSYGSSIQWKLDLIGWIAAACVEVTILLAGILLHILTGSWVILAVAIFGPPIVVLLGILYGQWVADDYHVLPGLCGRVRKKMRSATQQAVQSAKRGMAKASALHEKPAAGAGAGAGESAGEADPGARPSKLRTKSMGPPPKTPTGSR